MSLSTNNPVSVNVVGQPGAMQVSDCVDTTGFVDLSAIDEFDVALTALAKMAGTLGTADHPEVLAEMLIVSAVASTETYFRRLLSALAGVCPITMGNIAQEQVPIGAAAAYPRSLLGMSALESSLFSTRGTISRELKRFTRFELGGHQDLSAAVDAFELVCLTRHAAAHWRGHLDSRGARQLGLLGSPLEMYRISSNSALVQRALAACDYVVHLTNDVLFNFTVQKWIDSGTLPQEAADRSTANRRCAQLISVFGSSAYCKGENLTPARLRRALGL